MEIYVRRNLCAIKNLFAYLHAIHPLSATLQQHIQAIIKTKELSRKDYLLKQGRISKEICFLERGLLRCFYIKDDKEICSWFMPEGNIILSVHSFCYQRYSKENIQALEDCLLYYVTYDEMQYMLKFFPVMNILSRVITEQYYLINEQRLRSIIMQRSFDRYEYLMTKHPEFIRRIPSKYIASYLGLTEETLSRIRARI